MRILVGVLAGCAVPGYSPVGSMVVCPRARVGVLVAWCPCAVARHGSKSSKRRKQNRLQIFRFVYFSKVCVLQQSLQTQNRVRQSEGKNTAQLISVVCLSVKISLQSCVAESLPMFGYYLRLQLIPDPTPTFQSCCATKFINLIFQRTPEVTFVKFILIKYTSEMSKLTQILNKNKQKQTAQSSSGLFKQVKYGTYTRDSRRINSDTVESFS